MDATSQRRPSVLLMIADDHRHSALTCAGDPTVRTPTFDRVAASGVRLTGARCQGGMTGAICAPSRACLMSGSALFSATTDDPTVLNPEKTMLPEALRDAGYNAYAVGKWHNGGASLARGFDGGAAHFIGGMSDHDAVPINDFDPTGAFSEDARRTAEGFSTDIFADAVIDFLRGQDGSQPFFCYAAFTAPHDPRTPPEEFARWYDAKDMPVPPNFLERHPFDNGDMVSRDELLAAHPRRPAEIQQHIADYYGMISHLDHRIGTILQTLEESGLAEDTIVLYTADHGLAVGQHGLMGKQNTYEHSLRIPLLMSGPGIPVGREVDGFAYLTDVFPTLCDLLGVPVPATVEGQSLRPLIDGAAGQRHAHAAYLDVQRMVRDDRYKMIRYFASARGVGTDTVQLFDLASDPWERTDLSKDPAYSEQLRSLADALAGWMDAVGDPLAGRQLLPQ